MKEFGSSKLTSEGLKNILSRYSRGTSYNTLKRHLNVLINEAVSVGMSANPMVQIKSKKSKAVLHKPFENVGLVLEEIRAFNKDLHLCCLLTYGCLLRPHREVRELKWGDFSNYLNQVNLSGYRNKSGRNRIVPVPEFIREFLHGVIHFTTSSLTLLNQETKTTLKPYGGDIKRSVLPLKRDRHYTHFATLEL